MSDWVGAATAATAAAAAARLHRRRGDCRARTATLSTGLTCTKCGLPPAAPAPAARLGVRRLCRPECVESTAIRFRQFGRTAGLLLA